MGADVVIGHSKPLAAELASHNIASVDLVFATTQTPRYLQTVPDLLRPFGHFVLIDDPETLDIRAFKSKALTVTWELMLTKTLHNYKVETQGAILAEVAALVDSGKLKTTATQVLQGLTADNLRTAHQTLEAGTAHGKIVIEL